MENDWVKLATFSTIHHAEIVRGLLESQGIPAVVVNTKDSMYPFRDGFIYLYCHEDFVLQALDIIENNQPL